MSGVWLSSGVVFLSSASLTLSGDCATALWASVFKSALRAFVALRCRGAHYTRTSRTGRVPYYGPVPVLFQPCSSYLDERWTGRSRPVQDRRCTSITAVQTGRRVSPNFLRVKFYNFALFDHRSRRSLVLVVCPVVAVRFTSRNSLF